ncbi:MAG: tetratricopeptide repeat protein [Gammaproteobacteria bacterium]|jgi:tetratricopeptide (TPR) repeat protein|nr:tetratricopeptide repeat protein [Gammaproteobacteria bacterium]
MPVTKPVPSFQRLTILLLLLSSSACQLNEQPTDNRYQRVLETTVPGSPPPSGPVVQLQNQALAAINEDQYQLAIDYLQRAIKIQPRDAWSWHYLADIYWRQGQYDRCLAMIDRSSGYVVDDARLTDANAALRAQCQ